MNTGMGMEQKQTQKLSQSLLQSIRILQMSAAELNTYIEKLALENPVMDLVEPEFESIDKLNWLNSLNEVNHYMYQKANSDEPASQDQLSGEQGETLQEYLWSQLVSEPFTETETTILKFLLGSIDEHGYLTESVESTVSFFNCEQAKVRSLIEKLKSLEPAGICAETLQECLIMQLKEKEQLDETVERIILDDLDAIAENNIPALAKKYKCSIRQMVEYSRLIKTLNPYPGSMFFNHESRKYVIPDIVLVKFSGYFDVIINNSFLPQIRTNSYYARLKDCSDQEEVRAYLKMQMQEIHGVQSSIEKRNRTLLQLARYILEHQLPYFNGETDRLEAMSIRDAAECLSLHESTISRAIHQKYLQCSRGTFPLRIFFSQNIAVRTEANVENHSCYTDKDVKREMHEIINTEDKIKPLSDQKLCEKLQEKGFTVSRRTVSKYRESEHIPDARSRRSYDIKV